MGWRRENQNILKSKFKGQPGKVGVGRKGSNDKTAKEMGPYIAHKIQQM